jgi:hypothetical protein
VTGELLGSMENCWAKLLKAAERFSAGVRGPFQIMRGGRRLC